MQQIVINTPPNRGLPISMPHPRYSAIVFGVVTAAANRIVTAVAEFFQMIGFCFFSVISWPGDRLVDYLMERDFCKLLASMPVNERETARAFVLQLTQGMDRIFTQGKILKALINIPAEEREEVVRSVLRIKPEIEDYSTVRLIQAIAHLPVNERGPVIALVLGVITPDMDGFERVGILETVTGIPDEEREEVVTNAVLLIIPAMRAAVRILLIREMAAYVAVNERGQVTNLTLSVITPDLHMLLRASLLRVVARVPAWEREEVIHYARQVFTDEMGYGEIATVIERMADAPADERANLVQRFREGGDIFEDAPVDIVRGINVHQGDRDQRVRAAIELLRKHQGPISGDSMKEAVQAFTQYLNVHEMNPEHKRLAQHALLGPINPADYGPLIDGNDFMIKGLIVSGEEVVGRLWIFASNLTGLDQAIAKGGMISALKESYDEGDRVCQPGKVQRLIVSVLQGRLEKVSIELVEGMKVDKAVAMNMFFIKEAHAAIKQLPPLIDAANQFCDDNPLVNRDDFLRGMEEYAQVQFAQEGTQEN